MARWRLPVALAVLAVLAVLALARTGRGGWGGSTSSGGTTTGPGLAPPGSAPSGAPAAPAIVDQPPGSAILVAAGDIADCSSGAARTAALLDRVPGTVAAIGDTAYQSGTAREFARCYDPTWGRHKQRTRPVPGNHEYHTSGAKGYFSYFGAAAGSRDEGWYSYQLGAWHVVALNSNCDEVGGCEAGSPQERWLRADLAAHPARCTLAYWHDPRWSSGAHGGSRSVASFWQALADAGADVVLVGHDHDYERFAPLAPDGAPDPAHGIREFVVGTGGAGHSPLLRRARGSDTADDSTYGVLVLTLRADSYDWRFVPVAGAHFTDAGTSACH